MHYHLCHKGVKSEYIGMYAKTIITRRSMWMQEVWEPLWSSGNFDMYKEAHTCSTWEVTNVFCFVSFNEPLKLWLVSGVPLGQLLQIKFGPKTRSRYQRKHLFLPQWET